MIGGFTYDARPGRVLFGEGTLARLPEEVERLGLRRVLLLSTPPQEGEARSLAELLGSRAAGVFPGAVMHTPIEVTETALLALREVAADGIVAIGGGSTTGLGKALALRTDLPQIVVPTTYAGSEMTPILGETRDGRKTTINDPRVLPEVVIYDVSLTLTLPVTASGTSGINAIAHAVEALYARDANPITSLMALEGIRALHGALPAIARDPADTSARSDALYGAWLCGTCLGAVGMSLHHKLCHTLGGMFDLPHAETHAVILPHALAYNAPHIPAVIERLASALGGDPAKRLFELARDVGAPTGLGELGMNEESIGGAAKQAMATPYWNPAPLEEAGIRSLLARAWSGAPPERETCRVPAVGSEGAARSS